MAALAIAGAAATGTLAVQATPASASPGACSSWWAYMGGSTSSGGCKGAYGGTWFRVGEKCGPIQTVVYSSWTWAPDGVARSATTGACPWYSQGVRAAWVEW